MIYTVKGFSIVNEAEVDVFLEFPCFFYDLLDVGNLVSGSSAFSKSSLYIWKLNSGESENVECIFCCLGPGEKMCVKWENETAAGEITDEFILKKKNKSHWSVYRMYGMGGGSCYYFNLKKASSNLNLQY